MIFHVCNTSVHPSGIGIFAGRLIENLADRDVPPFRVDHFNNFTDGIFVILSEASPCFLRDWDFRDEVEAAVVKTKQELRLEHFSGHWLS